ncbi:MAG TPA: hypothetical protein H9680_02535 [Firmicutes bacterium]|nr:hypothetical protein [Bacillota bacterium]
MLEKSDLLAIAELMNTMMDDKLKPVYDRLDKVDARLDKVDARLNKVEEQMRETNERLSVLEEDSKITRNGVNNLLDWAEDAQNEVKIPLYKKA